MNSPSESTSPDQRFNPLVAQPGRRYDYWLGGKDGFAADRESGDQVAQVVPSIGIAVRENRRFLRRAVHWLAAENGVDQFVDVGAGLPNSPNVHEVAQKVNPSSRIVYVDNEPGVLAHARALLTGVPEGRTVVVDADLRHPEQILNAAELRATLDLSRPVGLLLLAVLHFLTEDDDPYGCVRQLVDALAPGSFVVLSHATVDPLDATVAAQVVEMGKPDSTHGAFVPRNAEQVGRFVTGLDLIDPGVVSVVDWHPADHPASQASATAASVYGAVAVKPWQVRRSTAQASAAPADQSEVGGTAIRCRRSPDASQPSRAVPDTRWR
jgi:hypothetical protein